MNTLRKWISWILVGLSSALYLVTVFIYARQPDHFAAFTVLPIWVWGALGLGLCIVAFYFRRTVFCLKISTLWAITLLLGSDEARVLTHFGKTAPQQGEPAPHLGSPVLRVVTLNCAEFRYGDPTPDIAAWKPDIVLLQEIHPGLARVVADALYQGTGDFRAKYTNSVITRWKITREALSPTLRNQQVTITQPDGRSIEVVNVHLASAATDMRFWKRSSWTRHRVNRVVRREEIDRVRHTLAQSTDPKNTPILFGGDFNASATDLVHHSLKTDFIDTFASAGTGWGNTFQRRFPILRIDLLYASSHFTPVRCSTSITRFSDHRMVVSDLLCE